MKLKIGLAQNILYQFNIFCTGTKTNCTKVQIELQHTHDNKMNRMRSECFGLLSIDKNCVLLRGRYSGYS